MHLTMEVNNQKSPVADMLFERLSFFLKSPVDRFRHDTLISSIALDSIVAVTILSDLQDRFKVDLPIVLFWEKETLGELAEYVQSIIENRPS
jgi:acyl carrier protein